MRKNSFAMRRSFLRVLKELRLIAKRRRHLSEASTWYVSSFAASPIGSFFTLCLYLQSPYVVSAFVKCVLQTYSLKRFFKFPPGLEAYGTLPENSL